MAGAAVGALFLLVAAACLLRQDGAVDWVAGLDPVQLAAAVAVAFLAAGAVAFVAVATGVLVRLLLGVHGTPHPASPWLRTREIAGAAAVPLAGLAITAALAGRLARAQPHTLDQGALVSFVLGGAFVTGHSAADAGRLTAAWIFRRTARLADVAVSRERFEAERRMRTLAGRPAGHELIAEQSAVLAAAAWDGRTATADAARVGAYLAGNEAETLVLGLRRLALCCRADGAVPLDAAGRLAAAGALAEHAHALRPHDWFTAGALALVRVAQRRPADARRLVRPHLETRRRRPGDDDVYLAQLLAIAALTEVAGDPDRAIAQATAAWERLPVDGRDAHPAAETVANVLAHVRRATGAGAGE